jgi:hypothetical protein
VRIKVYLYAFSFEATPDYLQHVVGYRTMILLVSYGCATGSFAPRKKKEFRVFENKVACRIFGPNSGEVTGEWRKLLDKNVIISVFHQILLGRRSQRVRWAAHVARMGTIRDALNFWLESFKDDTV